MITFLIFLAILTYVYVIINVNIEKSTSVAEKISTQRIFYTWKDVSEDVSSLLNINLDKNDTFLEINDTLPATKNIGSLLDIYQEFTKQIYGDPTIEVNFEDIDGNRINLSEMENSEDVFNIEPMNIVYTYPDFGKNELIIKVDESNFSFIENVSIFVKLKNVEFDCNYTHSVAPDYCGKWSPDNSVPSCSGVTNCLTLNLTFEDSNNIIFNLEEKYFDVDSRSTNNLNVKNVTGNYFIKSHVGGLPSVVHIDLQNVFIDTTTDIYFNTSDFYINLPSILNVTTPFGRKVDLI
jgi:hypothetical protein